MMEILKKYGEVFSNYNLEKNNTYGVKSVCKYFIKIFDVKSLIELIEYLNSCKEKYFVIGGGSNIILECPYYDCVFISLTKLNNITYNDNLITCESGISLSVFINKLIDKNLGGIEELALIPGTLGGALYGNAGCHNVSIYDFIENITVLRNNNLVTLNKTQFTYSYRDTSFKKTNDIIISATFKLISKSKMDMKELIKKRRKERLEKQPLEYKNAGSVFKNPLNNESSGLIIEKLGLKKLFVNDAEVSEKHANFIINKGNASGKDIINLINKIKKIVKEEKNINLELEQIIVNNEKLGINEKK